MRRDIKGILKNALEHGATMEKATQSLINSGYNDTEVREAANQISPGAISTLSSKVPIKLKVPAETPGVLPKRLPAQLIRQPINQKPLGGTKPKGTGKIILLSLILLIFIVALVTTIIFKDQVVDFLTNLF